MALDFIGKDAAREMLDEDKLIDGVIKAIDRLNAHITRLVTDFRLVITLEKKEP